MTQHLGAQLQQQPPLLPLPLWLFFDLLWLFFDLLWLLFDLLPLFFLQPPPVIAAGALMASDAN